LWPGEYQLLEEAAIQLGVDLEFFVAERDFSLRHPHATDNEVALLRVWLEVQDYPDWHLDGESVLDDLSEQELFLALAKWHLDLSSMTIEDASTPEDQLHYRNVALTASESVLDYAEQLSLRVRAWLS